MAQQSSLDPIVDVYTSSNGYMVEAGSGRPFDGVAEFRVSETGTYYARVSDRNSTVGVLAHYSLDPQIIPTGSQNFPNLQVTSVSLPTETGIQSGESVTISYKVQYGFGGRIFRFLGSSTGAFALGYEEPLITLKPGRTSTPSESAIWD